MPTTVACWCCDQPYPESELTRLGAHPEVAVCGDCARFLQRRALAQRHRQRPSIGGHLRAAVDAVRQRVIARGWPTTRWLGPVLRRLDRHLP